MLPPVSEAARGSAEAGGGLVYRWSKDEPVLALHGYSLSPLTHVPHLSLEEVCEEQSLPDLLVVVALAYPCSQSSALSSVSGPRARGGRHDTKIVLLYTTWDDIRNRVCYRCCEMSVTIMPGRASRAVFKRQAVWLCSRYSQKCATTNSGRITVSVSSGCISCIASM